jgi:hypothetical protein
MKRFCECLQAVPPENSKSRQEEEKVSCSSSKQHGVATEKVVAKDKFFHA